MSELRKGYSEEEMNNIARQAMAETAANIRPGQSANKGEVTRIPYNKMVPVNIPTKTPEQMTAEEALSKMANRAV